MSGFICIQQAVVEHPAIVANGRCYPRYCEYICGMQTALPLPPMTKKRRRLTILLLGLLTTVVPFSIDMYLPGFGDIATGLHTTIPKVAFSLSSFFLGLGLSQLVYGPLLDRFGRTGPLYTGLLLYVISSIGCAFAPSIEVLIGLRFVQAVGACAAMITATAIVRDLFDPNEIARIYSFLILVLSVSPMLAPTAGSFLSATFGWPSIFIVLTALIILIWLGVYFFLGETRKADPLYSLKASAILRSYGTVLRTNGFVRQALIGGLALAGMFVYIASSPGLFIEQEGLSQKQYGGLFALLASGLIIASQLNRIVLKKYSSPQIIRVALFIQVIFGALLLAVGLLQMHSFWL
ncbi:MAG: MgtE intracellular domain protein, partial [Sediminibacterium sp.]|nr:MgtE intracellular domain protein [Sediminibacterium sp.]